MDIKKILIVKLGALGDCIFSTPLIRVIKKGFSEGLVETETKITYLTTKWSKDIIEYNPYLDEVLVFDNASAIPSAFRTILNLRKKRFDVVFILHRTILSNLFIFLCNIPERIGFDYKNNGLFLTKKVKFDENKHEVDRYLDLAFAYGIKPDGIDTELKVPDDLKEYARKLFLEYGINNSDIKIGILAGGGNNPGTFMPIKRLSEDKLALISDTLIEEFNAKIIFVGDENDGQFAEGITKLMKRKPVNLVGKTTKKQLLGVLSNFTLFIAGDSGPLHMASSIDIPTIGIFGPSDPRLVAPREKNNLYIWKHVKCSPCYTPESVWKHLRFSSCPLGTLECMKSITVDDILQGVRFLLFTLV